MSYLALYRKYRPSNLEEVVGQNKITRVIRNEIINNKVSHAYLFCGPRGTGKTTMAKLIAKMVNCKDLKDGIACGKCDSCKGFLLNSNDDIIEIDAASNNGIDEIREIRDNVNLVPSMCKYKIYIIDEVHMLTVGAFNALLKTLEEPPSHVIFILATTEFYKIPMTVVSRCQRFNFERLSIDDIKTRLKEICDKENIKIDDDCLMEIARIADGGMRDAINFLDQLYAFKNGNIKIADIYEVSGTISYNDYYEVVNYLLTGDACKIINFMENKNEKGINYLKFIDDFIIFLKDILVYKNTKVKHHFDEKQKKIVELAQKIDNNKIYSYIDMLNNMSSLIKTSSCPNVLLEINFIKLLDNYGVNVPLEFVEKRIVKQLECKEQIISSEKEKTSNVIKKDENKKQLKEDKINSNMIKINNAFATADKTLLIKVREKWSVLTEYLVSDEYNVVAGMLVDAMIVVAGEKNLVLATNSDAVAKRINDNEKNVKSILNVIYNQQFEIVAVSFDEWKKEKEEYIMKTKNGYKYEYIDENIKEIKKNKKKNIETEELESVLGEEFIEYK